MWRLIIALLLLSTGQIWAQENATAYDALRVVGTQLGRGALNHIVSITGVKGHPQPEKWKIILESPRGSLDSRFYRRRNDQCFTVEPGFEWRICGSKPHSGRVAYAVCDSGLRVAHRRARRTDLGRYSFEQIVATSRHDIHRCESRHREENRGNVCWRDHGGR